MYKTELTCPDCQKEFDVDWTFGDDVTCPLCQTVWETEWDTNIDDDIYGPWITGKAK